MLHLLLEERLRAAITALALGIDPAGLTVRPCQDPRFGDYQTSWLMAVAKQRRGNPRQFAAEVVAKLDVADLCEQPEIAGSGFINFRITRFALARCLAASVHSESPFISLAANPRTVVVDFSSPNVAKPMHVGHIRSTILGDSIARTLRLLGHRVITDNHIGDWGTQFGMLLTGWKTVLRQEALAGDPIGELERVYKLINAKCDPGKPGFDQSTLDRARTELVKLQSGEPENLSIWRRMIALSQTQFDTVYGRLGVLFDQTLGESCYNSRLEGVVEDLVVKGLARASEGAIAVFSDRSSPEKDDPYLVQRDGAWIDNPQLIRKGDGGFNYSTTDLATIAYRIAAWRPDEIIYVTDGRQQLHFRQLFATFRRWQPEAHVRLEHVWFGTILGDDGRPLKTRSGETVKLVDLLDEAEERAYRTVTEKNPTLDESDRREIARIVGVGSVKYADLLPNRQTDYIFSWDKMLSFSGNTAPYLQYTYARIQSILRKAGNEGALSIAEIGEQGIEMSSEEEVSIVKHLVNFGLVLENVAAEYRPNFLCNYLFELSGHFSRFFENCPVLKAEGKARATRLVITDLTGRVLKTGLGLLGIETTDRM